MKTFIKIKIGVPKASLSPKVIKTKIEIKIKKVSQSLIDSRSLNRMRMKVNTSRNSMTKKI